VRKNLQPRPVYAVYVINVNSFNRLSGVVAGVFRVERLTTVRFGHAKFTNYITPLVWGTIKSEEPNPAIAEFGSSLFNQKSSSD
jgi:hypothetical protein